jgi:hypothetical protein
MLMIIGKRMMKRLALKKFSLGSQEMRDWRQSDPSLNLACWVTLQIGAPNYPFAATQLCFGC